MKKIIRLTERDLTRLIKRIIKETHEDEPGEDEMSNPHIDNSNKIVYGADEAISELNHFIKKIKHYDKEEFFDYFNAFVQHRLKKQMNKANMMGIFTNDDLNIVLNYINSIKFNYDKLDML